LGSLCDPMESFNSKNVDIFSNILVSRYAEYHMSTILGSGCHVHSAVCSDDGIREQDRFCS
jgi:hypothetical protein